MNTRPRFFVISARIRNGKYYGCWLLRICDSETEGEQVTADEGCVAARAGHWLCLACLAWLEESITPLLLPWLTAESRHRAPDGDGKTRDGGGCGKVSTSHTSVLTVRVDQISAIFSRKPETPPQPGSGEGTEAAALPGCHDLV